MQSESHRAPNKHAKSGWSQFAFWTCVRAPVQRRTSFNPAAEVMRERQQAAATRSSPPSTADAERLWDKYERVAEEKSKAAAAALKAK